MKPDAAKIRSAKIEEVTTRAKHNGQGAAALGLGETLGHSLVERIGNTPLIRLDGLTRDLPGITLLGKAEWYNPGGSVKDRAAANIVAEGRRTGHIRQRQAGRATRRACGR